MEVYEGTDLYCGKPGDFRVRAMPAEAIGDDCGYPGCGQVAMYYLESRGTERFKTRRACLDHAESWFDRRKSQEGKPMAKQAKVSKPEPKKVGRPRSSEKKKRVHLTIGGLALEILAGYGSGAEFNASRFVEDAIIAANANESFRGKLGRWVKLDRKAH